MFRWIDKIFCVAVVAPPLYLLFRFLRWYAKQELHHDEEAATES
jgi:hypothetical protein